jgi:hypothetical protein
MRSELDVVIDELKSTIKQLEASQQSLAAWRQGYDRIAVNVDTLKQSVDGHAPVFALTAQASRFQSVVVRCGARLSPSVSRKSASRCPCCVCLPSDRSVAVSHSVVRAQGRVRSLAEVVRSLDALAKATPKSIDDFPKPTSAAATADRAADASLVVARYGNSPVTPTSPTSPAPGSEGKVRASSLCSVSHLTRWSHAAHWAGSDVQKSVAFSSPVASSGRRASSVARLETVGTGTDEAGASLRVVAVTSTLCCRATAVAQCSRPRRLPASRPIRGSVSTT